MGDRSEKIVNIWVARFLPLILTGLIGYSAYVVTKLVAIDYLIYPPSRLLLQPRLGSAIAILVFYYISVVLLFICYARLLQTIAVNPGYVPRSAAWIHQHMYKEQSEKKHKRGYHSERRPLEEKPSNVRTSWQASDGEPQSPGSNHSSLTYAEKHKPRRRFPDLEHGSSEISFWHRDVFICDPDGRPQFCSACLSHKQDRTHHCSELDRCILKMDHFCPWVGGIISETSFKFFIQFLVYAAFFCLMTLTTMAVFVAERRRREGVGFLNVHYYLILGLSALFLLFTVGMGASSIQFCLVNTTTIENLNRRSKVWFLAVLIPRSATGELPPPPGGAKGISFQTINYPRPPEEQDFLVQQARDAGRGATPSRPPPPPTTITGSSPSLEPPRTFAILHTKPGESPFDIDPWTNIREVLGYTVAEWLLPIKLSPLTDHRDLTSAFKMNQDLVRKLQRDAGLIPRIPVASSPAVPAVSTKRSGRLTTSSEPLRADLPESSRNEDRISSSADDDRGGSGSRHSRDRARRKHHHHRRRRRRRSSKSGSRTEIQTQTPTRTWTRTRPRSSEKPLQKQKNGATIS
jgi:palmitoyltransferase